MNSMLWDSPTPDAEKGSEKFLEEGGGEKRPEEAPIGKLVVPIFRFASAALVLVTQDFFL